MNVIETKQIRKEYGATVAVNNIDLSIEKGHVWGLIGPNGAGKTTLLRMLATVLRPTAGTALILGQDICSKFLKVRKQIGYMPDFFNLYNDLKLWECLEFFARAYRVEKSRIRGKIDEVLKFVDLEHKRDSYIKHLSRGMVQRMGVAVLLVHEPEVFILDEPASGLDPKARIQLRDVLRRLSSEGKTVIISSHILTELSGFCSHIAIMNEGRVICQGSVEDVEQQVMGAHRLRVTVLENADKAAEILRQFETAEITEVSGNIIKLDVQADAEKLAEINARLVHEGLKVSEFSREKADLETLFMKISAQDGQTITEGQ